MKLQSTVPALAAAALTFAIGLSAITTLTASTVAAATPETAARIVATSVRRNGFECTTARAAVQIDKQVKPHMKTWQLKCDNAWYIVRYTLDQKPVIVRFAVTNASL